MPRLNEQITVHRPIEEAFRYTADFSRVEDWDPGVVASTQTISGPVDRGTTFDLTLAFGTRRLPMVYTVTEYDPPHRIVLVGEGSIFRAVDEITFAEVPQGTTITYTADLTFHGLMKWIAPVLVPTLRRAGRRAVQGLAGALESHA